MLDSTVMGHGRDGALRRPRRVQRRNDAARCFAGGDIAARCPYQSQVHGKPLSFFACIGTMNHPLTRPPGTLSPSEGERDGVRGRFMEREKLDGELCSWIWGAHIQFKPPNTRNTPKQKPWRAG